MRNLITEPQTISKSVISTDELLRTFYDFAVSRCVADNYLPEEYALRLRHQRLLLAIESIEEALPFHKAEMLVELMGLLEDMAGEGLVFEINGSAFGYYYLCL